MRKATRINMAGLSIFVLKDFSLLGLWLSLLLDSLPNSAHLSVNDNFLFSDKKYGTSPIIILFMCWNKVEVPVLWLIYSCFQIKLCDVEEVELLDRRGYLVISVTLTSRGEGKIYLRKTEGIRDWFNSLKVSLLYVLTVYSLSKWTIKPKYDDRFA